MAASWVYLGFLGGVSEGQALVLCVVAGLAYRFAALWPVKVSVLGDVLGNRVQAAVLVTFLCALLIAVLLLWADPLLCQALFVLAPVLGTLAYLSDMLRGRTTFARLRWADDEWHRHRTAITRLEVLRHLLTAVVLAAAMQGLSLVGWLVFIGAWPLVGHYLSGVIRESVRGVQEPV